MEINIRGSNVITGSSIGTGNIVCTGNGGIDWEHLQKEWLVLLGNLPTASLEYDGSSKVLKHILNKDKHELLKSIKSHAASFSSNLFVNIASPFIVEFIRNHI